MGQTEGGTISGKRRDLPPGRTKRKGGAHPVGEGEAGQRLPSLHPGMGVGDWGGPAESCPGGAAQGAVRRRCLSTGMSLHRDASPHRTAGKAAGRQTKDAPHSTRPKWLEGQGAGVRACVGGRQQMPPSASSSGKDLKTPPSARVVGGS